MAMINYVDMVDNHNGLKIQIRPHTFLLIYYCCVRLMKLWDISSINAVACDKFIRVFFLLKKLLNMAYHATFPFLVNDISVDTNEY